MDKATDKKLRVTNQDLINGLHEACRDPWTSQLWKTDFAQIGVAKSWDSCRQQWTAKLATTWLTASLTGRCGSKIKHNWAASWPSFGFRWRLSSSDKWKISTDNSNDLYFDLPHNDEQTVQISCQFINQLTVMYVRVVYKYFSNTLQWMY